MKLSKAGFNKLERVMLEGSNEVFPGDIAVVGMALRVPGARNVNEFWSNLRQGVESIRTLSPEELMAEGEKTERTHQPNYVPRCADLADMEMFDADFFGLSPKEAAIMDPQHRHFLECVWEAIEDSGRIPTPGGEPVGVFAGCGMGSYFYFNVCSNRHLVDQVGMFLLRHTGNDKDFLSTRASFTFDLHGPSVNVQTACSTSLVAIHYACQSLLNGECDTALAGGVTIELPHRQGYTFNEGEILSPDGHCRPFDHRAAGTVFGSGVGVVMLRRLSDALKDGDIIHTVIKGTAINNDGGSKAGYLAPSVDGQAAAIVEAQGLAGVRADSIGYVECHGTGTYLGDPIEIEGLTQAFRQSTDRKGFCHVGSVKSNIGHLDTAAGVVGLIKAALVLKNGEIPPTLGFESPNPSINFAQSPFMVNNTLVKWPAAAGRRRAAVNSLGVGGTNAHVILEQSPASYMAERAKDIAAEHIGDDPLFLLLSARQRKGLDQAADRLSSTMVEQPGLALSDIGYTLLRGRKHFEHRLILPVRQRQDALAALSDIEHGFVHTPVENPTGAVFLFPGGGAQHPSMARALYEREKSFRLSVDEGLSYLSNEAETEIRSVWFGENAADAAKAFRRPSVQLPAILIVEVALARLWLNWGIKPVALIGHSMGEYAAACLSGVMTFKDAVSLVRLRGELFETVPKGGMLSVPLEAKVLAERLPPQLDIASINAPALCVVSGLDGDLDNFRDALSKDGIEASRIPIDIAAHSRLLESILAPFEAFLRKISLRHPSIPIISNRTGLPLSNQDAADPMYWVGHLRGTVRFAEGLATLATDPGHIYLEVGPGRVLSSLTKMQGSIPANQVINSLPHPDEAGDDHLYFMAAIGRAFATGLDVKIDRLFDGRSPKRVTLPSYPFQHRRYFIERSKEGNASEHGELVLAKEPDLTQWGYRPTWKQTLSDYEQGSEKEQHAWLFFLDEAGLGLQLVERLRALGHQVATVSLSDSFTKRGAGDYTLCPELGRAGYDALLAGLAADGALPSKVVHMWLVTEEEKYRPGSNFFHRNQECGFHSLLHLAQALGDVQDAVDMHFTVITNGMQQVASEALPYPEKATVLGPALVLPKEMDGATVRLIDIDLPHKASQAAAGFNFQQLLARKASNPDTNKTTPIADQLWEEINAPSACETIALRQGRRWSRVRRKMQLPEVSPQQTKLRQNGVYFFAGGLSEVALAIAGEFARQLKARIVLVGRTVLPSAEEWDFYERTHGHDNVRRAIAAIRRLESDGAEVLYLTGDVTNFEEMTKAVEAAKSRFGRIDGVFHAAGVIDDNLMQAKTQESIEQVLAPKVLGTTVLASVFQDVPLDLFVMFSSTSTDIVRAGQVDYVAANAYLNAFAQSASQRTDRATVAVHWGIWNEVGIAARAVGAGPDTGSALWVAKPIAGSFFQNWIEDEQGVPWLEATVNPTSQWMLNEHRLVSGQAVMPGTGYLELIAQAAKEYGLPFEIDIKDLVFLAPLVFAGSESKIVRVRLEPLGGNFRAIITAGASVGDGPFTRHSEAVLEVRAAGRPKPLSISSLAARCETKSIAEAGATLDSVQEKHIRFGPRWRVLQSMAVGRGEALAELALDAAYVGDLADGVLLHPALLDIATGFALALADEYGASNSLWAPATYEQVSLHGPLPARIVSWVRLADNQNFGPGYAVFDIVIADGEGKVFFEARGFVMRRLDSNLHLGEVASDRGVANVGRKHEAASPAKLKLASQVRNGILPGEGFDVLARALATSEPQPIVSSISLDTLEQWVEKSEASSITKGEEFERPELENEFVTPRNPVEETLASFWRELLGIAQIGVHDSFFDVGGHSLLAVRLFRMIKGQYGLDLPISFLFEAPTIAQCSDHILSQLPDPDDTPVIEDKTQIAPLTRPTHVVLLSEGKDKSATPLFICAGMFGNVLNLRHIALALSADRPVYGLQARGLYGDYEPHATFEEMARDYIAEIQVVQPHGPYLLAGYSGGGICAYEMALQLTEQGEEVAHVVMLDTPLPTQPELQWRDRVDMKLQDLNRHKIGLVKQWLHKRRQWKAELRSQASAESEHGPVEQFNNKKIEVVFRRALLTYQVRPYSGAVTLFRPKPDIFYYLSGGRHLQENRNIVLADNGWTAHISSLHVSEVPGDHDSMVLDPYVRVLASRIRAILAKVIEQRVPRAEKPEPVSRTSQEHSPRALVEHV